MQSYINFNGSFLEADSPVIPAQNRGLRYGDGLFETLKVINGHIVLEELHFARLFSGLNSLLFDIPSRFTPAFLQQQIIELCQMNRVENAGRVRLNVFRGSGGLYDLSDPYPQFVIEAGPLAASHLIINEEGWHIDIYPAVRKSCDSLSPLKSNNYLPYVMGAFFAKQQGLNDCLLLNAYERICDATIANIFWITKDTIFTPPLTEGCVAGVMRQHLLNVLPQSGFGIEEIPLHIQDLQQAEEIFLTNAIYGIRWVKMFQDRHYKNDLTLKLFELFIKKMNS